MGSFIFGLMMIVSSLNIGEAKTVLWRGRHIQTGIYKYPVEGDIYLGTEDVENDSVVDRRYHGGVDKACYAYGAEAYDFWSDTFPDSDFQFGFFGENLTISGLSENEIRIGDRYQIGEAIIEVSQPRQPCFKLGIRFGSQKILKTFINSPFPGVYFRVIQSGSVSKGDKLSLITTDKNELTVLEVYKLLYRLIKEPVLLDRAINSEKLADSAKAGLRKR